MVPWWPFPLRLVDLPAAARYPDLLAARPVLCSFLSVSVSPSLSLSLSSADDFSIAVDVGGDRSQLLSGRRIVRLDPFVVDKSIFLCCSCHSTPLHSTAVVVVVVVGASFSKRIGMHCLRGILGSTTIVMSVYSGLSIT